MGMRKMKLFIAMVSVGALLGTMPVMAAEQPELPTKVQDIANGSDELYGEGVPIEHGTNPDERFSSGGVDHTHQYIVANTLKILSNDKEIVHSMVSLTHLFLWRQPTGRINLENETDAGTFAGHFYDPDTGKTGLVKNLRQLGQEQSHIFRQQSMRIVQGCTIGYVKLRKKAPIMYRT